MTWGVTLLRPMFVEKLMVDELSEYLEVSMSAVINGLDLDDMILRALLIWRFRLVGYGVGIFHILNPQLKRNLLFRDAKTLIQALKI